MGGPQIAVIVSLAGLAVSLFNVARESLWRGSTTPDWVGWLALTAGLLATLLALAALLAAIGRGPRWVHRAVDALLAPADLTLYPDMTLLQLIQRECPHLGPNATPNVPAGQHQRCGELLNELRQHGRLGRLRVWGRHLANPGFEEHTPLSEIPADFWQRGDLDYLEVLRDYRGKAERREPGRDREWYDDIWFNERQVNRVYPTGRPRLKFRLPWTREVR